MPRRDDRVRLVREYAGRKRITSAENGTGLAQFRSAPSGLAIATADDGGELFIPGVHGFVDRTNWQVYPGE